MVTKKINTRPRFKQDALRELTAAPQAATNRKLADRFADAKRDLAEAEVRVASLREAILLEGGSTGDEWDVTVTQRSVQRLDRDKLEARFGKAAVAECSTKQTSTYVELRKAAGARG